MTLGLALQLPAHFALGLAGPLFYIFAVGGSILFATGLAWVGWALWSGNSYQREGPGLSNLDQSWGGPLVLLTGLLLAIDAMLNMFGGLSLASGISHLLSIQP
jgi:TRAP-type C4-dicarboxylate transport system permease small subunit